MSNQKWEYLVKKYKEDNLEEELNKLGKIGWELISVESEHTKYICVFKKSIPIKVKSKTELEKEKMEKSLELGKRVLNDLGIETENE